MQTISDPRQYTVVYPDSNIVINQAIQVLENKLELLEFESTLASILQRENDALINVALNLAPSVEVSQLIWQALNQAINNYNMPKPANVFAIPLVLVAGAKAKTKLKAQVDVTKLNQLCTETQIFAANFDCFISGKLVDPQNLSQIKPSQLYYWARNLNNAKLWLPTDMPGTAVEVVNEGVFLRFLIGVTIDTANISGLNTEAFTKQSMAIMQFIHAELKTDGITLFAIPFAPVPLSQAFITGNDYRKEIAIQVAVSNVVRKIREQRLTPVAVISSDGEALKLTIKSKEPAELTETSLWHLNRFDDFATIVAKLTSLLDDIQIEWSYAKPIN
jgi:hypothetical protein